MLRWWAVPGRTSYFTVPQDSFSLCERGQGPCSVCPSVSQRPCRTGNSPFMKKFLEMRTRDHLESTFSCCSFVVLNNYFNPKLVGGGGPRGF